MLNEEFIKAFEDHSLPRSEWTHLAHIRAAWIYLSRFTLADALERVRAQILTYNASKGISPGLYHETITVFYVHAIFGRMQKKVEPDWELFCAINPDLITWRPSLIEQYYTKKVLYSETAKKLFVQPDLKALEYEYLPPSA